MENVIIILAILFCFIVFLNFRSKDIVKKKPKLKKFGYKLIYNDANETFEYKDKKLLYNDELKISGMPDYIFSDKNETKFIVVELKSGEIGDRQLPHESNLMQIATYFAIVEEEFDAQKIEGRIIYRDYMFKVKNTKKLRKKLEKVLYEMRNGSKKETKQNKKKCLKCPYRREICDLYKKY